MLFWKKLARSHIVCNCRRVPRYIMCFMLFSSRSLNELRQLNRRRCHQLSREERLPSLIVWSEHGQRGHLGNCWSDGKGAVWLRPLGNHLNSLKKTTLMSSSRTSCFTKGGQYCGLLLWSLICEKEQAGPQPELVKIELSVRKVWTLKADQDSCNQVI
jgi:hypothetical protein